MESLTYRISIYYLCKVHSSPPFVLAFVDVNPWYQSRLEQEKMLVRVQSLVCFHWRPAGHCWVRLDRCLTSRRASVLSVVVGRPYDERAAGLTQRRVSISIAMDAWGLVA